jgi:NAD(P)-dependent dehydrogenase (short-subunit alcohol dehydrogenase family)
MPENQNPISSPYNAHSTAADVADGLDLIGKTAIVTGGYSGLGLETVRALSGAGASVIVPARDVTKATQALDGTAGAEVVAMDLTDRASIAAFASGFLARDIALPILINSAGVMATPFSCNGEGHERQFSTNHLGHFRLAKALWPALVKAQGARIVSVSSRGHQIAGVDFDDINFQRRP